LIADLKAGLVAAEQLAELEDAKGVPTSGVEQTTKDPVDTSGMPGGVDSAPVTEQAPAPVEDPAMQPGGVAANTPVVAAAGEKAPILEHVEQDAETDAIDIIAELRKGESIATVANKLLDQTGLVSIVKAIRDLI
jgi:hypothetical protein